MELAKELRDFPFGPFPEFLERFHYHQAHPEISVAEYRQVVQGRQADRALRAHRLYLDTNHWTHLRDAALGRPRVPEYRPLLELLRRLVETGTVIVVLSDQLIDEVCHQADPLSREATAELIDSLTQGATIIGFQDRKFIEIRAWVAALVVGGSPIPLDRVWTTVMHVYKELDFRPAYPDMKLADAFMKTIEDFCHRHGMRGIIGMLKSDTSGVAGWRRYADDLTRLKSTDWKDQGSFSDVFVEEALAYLDKVLANSPQEVVSDLQRLPHGASLQRADLVVNTKTAFLACEQLGLLPTSLPTLRVLAGANSRMRAEHGRRFKPGDGADVFHAAAAVPYCNAFLTDRSLRHLLSTEPTNFAGLFGTTVISSPVEAIQYLSRLDR